MKTEILYEDQDIIVIRKPAALAVQTACIGQADAVSELKKYLAAGSAGGKGAPGRDQPYLGVIHRLDQPVEGLLVFAKNKNSAGKLSRQLSEGSAVHKQYYAVFCGRALSEQGKLVDYMYKEKENRAVILTEAEAAGDKRAKKAVLQYRILQESAVEGIVLSLAEIRIETGRFHQIRAQMAHSKMALLGDRKYGGKDVLDISRRLGIQNAALCAFHLEFDHPVTGQRLSFRITPQGKAFSYFQL